MEENPCVLKKLDDALMTMSRDSRRIAGQEWRRRSIYRLPTFVTNLKSKTFNPQIVSIGPYHHGDEKLKAMEEYKLRALLHFLQRANEPLQSCVNALIEVVQELKDAYDQLDLKWQQNTEEFLQLMILDGCFILEILLSIGEELNNDDDPLLSVLGKRYLMPFIWRDMLMLENQLPLLVLEKLLSVQPGSSADRKETKKELTILILNFLRGNVFINRVRIAGIGETGLHMLDIYRKTLALEHYPRYKKVARTTRYEIIPSATELYEFGIKFRKSKSRRLLDISFRGGVLHLPVIVFDDKMESLLANMIAFERFHVGAGNEISSYFFFMDCIIKSSTDVTLLQSHGIVQNALGSNKAVVNLVNSLSNSLSVDVTLDPDNDLFEVHEEVRAYCMRPWNRWRANLMHDYFNNPKDTFNLQMGIFLFIFTIIQTIFTVLSYTS